eukprot:TRINITY_DN1877_c0_g1_i3.p1 TRINITY_DN1877_c0_g1~~TRINITY_DN1877_c0_g1_i3.p1  ORF type:complete len:503 (-),score=105.82 TRINITY_DN1877_c0_g1_i3:117-1430(-)
MASPGTSQHGTAATSFGCTATGVAAAAVAAVSMARSQRTSRVERRVVGVCMPLDDKFDPLNLGNSDAKMDRYTAVEIKHGRIAMIACVGYLVPDAGFRWPGCETYGNGLAALSDLPVEGWIQLVAVIGAHEVLVKPRQGGMGPSDFGQGVELLEGVDEEEIERKQTSERNNGRLAMIAIMGMMWQDGTFGMSPVALFEKEGWWGPSINWLVADIPICKVMEQHGGCALGRDRGSVALRAAYRVPNPEIMKGANGPGQYEIPEELPEYSPAVPYMRYPSRLAGWVGGEKGFDPLCVTDALPVYWMREAELKHGRVCMLASVGWIATDLGLRFSDNPVFQDATTITAHDKALNAGYMLEMFGVVGIIELYGTFLLWQGTWRHFYREAGDFFIGKQFLPKDKEAEKSMKLKELENGRLAMLAFSGMATQAVITQQTWPFF